MWIEYFPGELFDYAYGGAVLNNSITNGGPPSVMAQVNDYLIGKHFNVSHIADETQYVFWGGANDILDTAQDAPQYFQDLAFGIPFLTAWQVGKLIEAGAKNILVMLMPTWAVTPVVTETATAAQLQQFMQITEIINAGIQANVSALVTKNVNLKFFDVLGLTTKILANPSSFGFTNVTAPCLANWELFINGTGGEAPKICSDPDKFLFWDGEHLTTKAHEMLAKQVMEQIGWKNS